MNYQKIYDQIIAKRRLQPWNKKDGYCEYHHIIPVSIGGNNDPRSKVFNINGTNVIGLTAKEHYICHILLIKIAEIKHGYMSAQHISMLKAISYFKTCSSNDKLKNRKMIRFSSRVYQCIREQYAKAQSISMIGKLVGSKNGMFGRKRTAEEKAKMSKTRIERSCSKGKNNPMYGISLNDILTPEKIKLWHQHQSEKLKGEKNPCYGRKWMHLKGSYDKKDRIYVKEYETQKYLDLGYVFGMKEVK